MYAVGVGFLKETNGTTPWICHYRCGSAGASQVPLLALKTFVPPDAVLMVILDTRMPRVRGSLEPGTTCCGTQPPARSSSRTLSPGQAGKLAVITLLDCNGAILLPSR